MQNPSKGKNSQSFLDKFAGKKSAISREGLLHLLDVKRNSLEQPSLPTPSHARLRHKHPAAPLAAINTEPIAPSSPPASRNSHHPALHHPAPDRSPPEIGEPRSMELLSQRVKLPAINKSTSRSSKAAVGTDSGELAGSVRLKPLALRPSHESLVLNSLSKKMELDQYALRHLEFMDKFERQLLGQQGTPPKRTARSEYH